MQIQTGVANSTGCGFRGQLLSELVFFGADHFLPLSVYGFHHTFLLRHLARRKLISGLISLFFEPVVHVHCHHCSLFEEFFAGVSLSPDDGTSTECLTFGL